MRGAAAVAVLFALHLVPGHAAGAVPPPDSQHFYLPLDISSGVAFGRGEPRPYAFRARLTPSVAVGRSGAVRVGAELIGAYENPQWVGRVGASASVRLWSLPLKELGLFVVVDHFWLHSNRPSSGAALLFDLDGLYRVGFRLDRDWREQSTLAEGTVGVDVPTLLKLLRGHRGGGVKLPSE